jgi:adenylate cyclase
MSPILITDLSADERFQGSESMKVSGLRSAMCAPLSAQNRLFGVLYVDNLQHTMAFTQDELNVFAVVASQAAAAIDNALAHSKIARQSLERAALERFLAPEVVELIAANPDKVRLGGANQEVSVLFADIRGFTSLSETLPPERIVEILNEYFTRVADVIFDHGGTLDKFLGDGLMAIFGAPISKGNDAANAVKAALSIQALMFELNRDAQARDWPELQVGIGVNTGIVTAGNIGSPKRIDYTVIGDAVNVSSRLCSNAKPGEVLISESTTAKVRGLFELKRLEPLQVKGKALPLNVFQVIAAARGTAGKL